jgi:hypothetical protein
LRSGGKFHRVRIDGNLFAQYSSDVKFGSMFKPPAALESKDATCPGCGSSISLDDINVAKDIALCRACGKVWSFAEMAGTSELSGVDLQNPPRGVRVTTAYDGGTKIIYRRISPSLLFLIPFTAAWGGFSMWGIYGSQIRNGHFQLFESLFGLPFLIGTIVLCSIILFGLFGRWEINVRRGEGTCFVGAGPIGWNRRFNFSSSARVSLEMSNFRSNNQPQEAITIQQDGQKIISFGSTISSREAKVFITAAMSRAMA